MENNNSGLKPDKLLILLIIYAAASLLHFTHNAIYIDEYPNLPGWISQFGVYTTWIGITMVGIIGYVLLLRQHRLIGLSFLALYGALGLDGLGHYALAPLSAHSTAMNLTIWLEVVSAILVLLAVALALIQNFKPQRGVVSG